MATARTRSSQPRSDIWTGLLVLAFLAQIAGTTFLAIDYTSNRGKPQQVNIKPPAAPAPVVPGQP